MNSTEGALEYRRLRAPREDGGTLVDPPLSEAPLWLERNLQRRSTHHFEVAGRPLAELIESARRAMFAEAARYMETYTDTPAVSTSRVVMTGHQPELFHPGVWFKNFVLDRLGQTLNAAAVHLVIDNDLPRAMHVRCPRRTGDTVSVARIPFDAGGPVVPFEERGVRDEQLFASFAERVTETLRELIDQPFVRPFWPDVMRALQRTGRIGLALAQARHLWERRWGLQSWDLPLSRLCDTEPFRWFAAYVMRDGERFAREYNEALWEYRANHGIRSKTHPVADLECDGPWQELPFWIWSEERPLRRRLFARRHGACLELSDRVGLRCCLAATGDDLTQAVADLERARRGGLKIRPRALITTMFARTLLSDLFLHGIGGAKYDQLTDEIAFRFFGLPAPQFYTVTATIRLPVSHPNVTPADIRRVDQLLRELRFHPERHVPREGVAEALIASKREWTRPGLPPSLWAARHEAVNRINEQFQPLVEPLRRQLLRERARLVAAERETAILTSREYAFCLYPEETLRGQLLDLARKGI